MKNFYFLSISRGDRIKELARQILEASQQDIFFDYDPNDPDHEGYQKTIEGLLANAQELAQLLGVENE